MKLFRLGLALGVAWGVPASANTFVVNTTTDATLGSCSATCTLRDAIALAAPGDTITFAVPLPATINLVTTNVATGNGVLAINKSLSIVGPGPANLTISAQYASRVLEIDAGSVSVSGATLRDGNPYAFSSQDIYGGCITIAGGATLTLDSADIRGCQAAGGSAAPAVSYSQTGDTGGAGFGGAVYIAGTLNLLNSSVSYSSAFGGQGGTGGDGDPTFGGNGGTGGNGGFAYGGELYVASGANLLISNSTLTAGEVAGGAGGQGGLGTMSDPDGDGGNGGDGYGGLVYAADGAVTIEIEFATLAHSAALPSMGGAGGFLSSDGLPGGFHGSAIASTGSANTFLLSSAIGAPDNGVTLCEAFITPFGNNLDEDSSCGANLHATFATVFHDIDANATIWPGYMPVWKSAVIDAAMNCNGFTIIATQDQHGTHRPQGSQCDIGAIEADYVFVGGFE